MVNRSRYWKRGVRQEAQQGRRKVQSPWLLWDGGPNGGCTECGAWKARQPNPCGVVTREMVVLLWREETEGADWRNWCQWEE